MVLIINENIYKPKFNIGDLVRISKYKKIFDKGYTANCLQRFL